MQWGWEPAGAGLACVGLHGGVSVCAARRTWGVKPCMLFGLTSSVDTAPVPPLLALVGFLSSEPADGGRGARFHKPRVRKTAKSVAHWLLEGPYQWASLARAKVSQGNT